MPALEVCTPPSTWPGRRPGRRAEPDVPPCWGEARSRLPTEAQGRTGGGEGPSPAPRATCVPERATRVGGRMDTWTAAVWPGPRRWSISPRCGDNIAGARRRRARCRGHGGRQGGRLRPRGRHGRPGRARRLGPPGSGVCTARRGARAARRRDHRAGAVAGCTCPGEDFAPPWPRRIDLSAASGPLGRAMPTAPAGRPLRAGAPQGRHRAVPNGAALADWPDLRRRTPPRPQAEGAARSSASGRTSRYADIPDHPMLEPGRAAVHEALEVAAVDRPHARGPAPGQLRGHPDPPGPALRPGPAGHRRLRARTRARRPARETPLRPAMTLTARVVLVKRVPAGQGVSYGHVYTTGDGHHARARPARATPTACRGDCNVGGRMRVRSAAAATVAGRVCMDQFVLDCGGTRTRWRSATTQCCSDRGTGASRPRRTGPTRLGTINYEIVTAGRAPGARTASTTVRRRGRA